MVYFTQAEIKQVPVVTVIGSTRFEEDMKDMARIIQSYSGLSLITSITKEPTYSINENILMLEGYKRLSISNSVVCINKDGYIGDNTAREYYFATFVKRIPVYFSHNLVTEKMLNYINAFVETENGDYYLWNFNTVHNLYKSIKNLYIRNTPRISHDVRNLLKSNINKEFLSSILSNDLRKQMKRNDCPVIMLEDNIFDSILRESKLFVPDNKEK